MSLDNGNPPSTPDHRPAADVSFHRLADQNGESSSKAESRSSWSSKRASRDEEEARGETRRSRDTPSGHSTGERKPGGATHRHRKSGGFLLEPALLNGSPREGAGPDRHGKKKAQNGHLYVEKRRPGSTRLSGDYSSLGSSPLSREVSIDHAVSTAQSQPSSRTPSMDPAQLVQMALDLSESRRRHVSGSLHVPLPQSRDGRRSSGLRASTGRIVSSHDQRRSYMSSELPYGASVPPDGDQPDADTVDDLPRDFTPATLSRAERARKYFELASEHRRLLQHLPPLKMDANAPGNHTFVTANSPGTTYAEITRVPSHANNKHELGRPYNPLQALRNRRMRARERQQLSAPPEAWQDTDRIRHWIDDVEAATGHPEYRTIPDRVQLPTYPGDDGVPTDKQESSKGHRRTETASSVITRPENGWSIEPSELLADTYWTEQEENKTLLESRQGSPLFPKRTRLSVEIPRTLEEDGDDSSRQSDKQQTVAEDVPFHKRAHRGPHLLPRLHKRPKGPSRSGSTTSVSSDEGRAGATKAYGGDDGDYNVGPLERHMRDMIAKDERGELSSPDMLSPDHWDSKHTQFPLLQGTVRRPHRDTVSSQTGGRRPHRDTLSSQVNGRLSVETARPLHRRARSADGRVDASDPRASMDTASSVDLSSPVMPGMAASVRGSSPEGSRLKQRSKLHKIPLFRNHSKERNNIERTDFATGPEKRPPSAPGLAAFEPRSSQESSRPSEMQRQRTADSYSSSLRRQGTATTSSGSAREPSSTVGRFFKGGRIGELVRNESTRFGGRFRTKDPLINDGALSDVSAVSDLSDLEDDDVGDRDARYMESGEPSPRTSLDQRRVKPKYYLQNLPSFKSPNSRNNADTPLSTDSDHISRQQRAQREAGRSTRFDRLAPPRINLPTDDDDTDFASNRDDTLLDARRKSYGFLGTRSEGTSQASLGPPGSNDRLPVTALSKLRSQGQRHWSISDRAQPQARNDSQVSVRDVARAKALLLSSGIKAREIQRRADTPREDSLQLYSKMSELTGKGLGSVPRKQEHVAASRMLSEHLQSALSSFETALEDFQTGSAQRLATQLDDLQRKAVDQLSKAVHETSDDADAFVVELTTKGPQDVKRVDDAIDDILRERRRQFRLLRRAGFKLLEWLVLGIMWWVWFIVVLFNTAKRVVVGLLKLLRWLFWF